MRQTKFQQLREGIKFPESSTIYRNIEAKLEEQHEKRAAHEQHKTQSDEEIDSLIIKIAEHNKALSDLIQKDFKTKSDKIKEIKKAVGLCYRAVNRIQKKASFGKCVEKLIEFISFAIIGELQKKEVLSDPEKVKAILRGDITSYNFETFTKTLADKIKCHNNSFTGKSGFYAALIELGFLIKKENFGEKVFKSKYGRQVRLTVNLDWIFGFSFRVVNGNSVKYVYKNLVNTGQSISEGVENLLPSTEAKDLQQGELPTSSEKVLVKGEKGSPPITSKTENWERFSAPAPAEPSIPKEVIDIAKELWNKAKFEVYTPEMFDNQRIRLNKVTYLKGLNPKLETDAIALMIDNIVKLRIPGEMWTDTKARISTCINRLGKYMKKHPDFYQYAPLMWLDIDMNDRTLKAYHDRYMKPKEVKKEAKSIENTDNQATSDIAIIPQQSTNRYDFIAWFIEIGADKYRVKRLVKKHSEGFITDCIRLGKAKVTGGFEADNGTISYIFGIINSKRHPDVIRISADEEELLLSQGLTFSKRKALERQKRRKNIETEVHKQLWYAQRIEAVRKEHAPQLKLDDTDLNALIHRANKQKAPPEQMAVWLMGLQKGRLKL